MAVACADPEPSGEEEGGTLGGSGSAALDSGEPDDQGADGTDPLTPGADDGESSGTEGSEPEPDREIEAGVWRLDGLAPDLPPEDLAPLWTLLGDAQHIALGEAVHSSGGFNAIKARVIRDGIRNHGVRVLAFESDRTALRSIDAYLEAAECSTPMATVLDGAIARVFADEHVAELLQWSCGWNQEHPDDRVHAFGFDVQQGGTDLAVVEELLAGFAEDPLVPALRDGISTCIEEEIAASGEPYTFTAEDRAACVAGLDAIGEHAQEQQPAIIERFGEQFYEDVVLGLVGIEAVQGLLYLYLLNAEVYPDLDALDDAELQRSIHRYNEPRDLGMATVYEFMVTRYFPEQRVTLWAANYHLAAEMDHAYDPTLGDEVRGPLNTGTWLGRSFGPSYAAVAITGYDPAMNWPAVGAFGSVGINTEPEALETRLHELAQPVLLVDPASEWAALPGESMIVDRWEMRPSDSYRAILNVDPSPGMDALFW